MSRDEIHVKEENLEDYMGDNLLIIDDDNDVDTAPNLKYPCLVLEGVTTSYEIDFLAQLNYTQDIALPLYIIYEGMYLEVGAIDFTCDSLLQFRLLDVDKSYRLTLHKTEQASSNIDIHDANTLEKLIKL